MLVKLQFIGNNEHSCPDINKLADKKKKNRQNLSFHFSAYMTVDQNVP